MGRPCFDRFVRGAVDVEGLTSQIRGGVSAER